MHQAPDPVIVTLLDEVERRLPELIVNVTDEIVGAIDLYQAAAPVPRDDLALSVGDNMREIVRALYGPAPDVSPAHETGRRRAEQSAPLPEVLRAFRIGFTEIWKVLAEQAALAGPDAVQELVSAATTLWSLADDYSVAVTQSYRDTAAEIMLRQQKERSVLVEALFSGNLVAQAELWQISEILQIPSDGVFVVVAAETPTLGKDALPEIESRLDAENLASAWRLTPELQVGVVSLRSRSAEEGVLELLRRHADARIGVSPAFRGLENTPRALHLARVTLASLPANRPGVRQFTESPLNALVASSPEEAVQLAHQVLSPVLRLGDDGVVLLDTLSAWFDSRGSTKEAAQLSYCHPNTVRYRLRKLQDELGRSLSNPADQAELLAALRALRTYPAAAVPLPAESAVGGRPPWPPTA
ncbi:PucR family transcriptional regulator [Prauserella alba]|uniref:Helix-turn-helix domain-containing protein n=2 Tax=Prauserella alba TaxID=176898 RepID=A0ABN1VIS8_9PSEU|nr:helix-turn-helix domain-containing protein [Prauserella alba]MCP2181955.1 PucR C-terminal helix-turn-helix domain-containing protein [Prauserella alba]